MEIMLKPKYKNFYPSDRLKIIVHRKNIVFIPEIDGTGNSFIIDKEELKVMLK